MKFLLVAVNAKYIHSNPAIRSLRAYSCMRKPEWERHIELAEYTINQPFDQILADICARRPDAVGFSCYIWNWAEVRELIVELAKILPKMDIWLGGPEVSYDPEEILNRYPSVTGIMAGEGEETFFDLMGMYLARMEGDGAPVCLEQIPGLICRKDREKQEGKGILCTGSRQLTDISRLPFFYETDGLEAFEDRILYYESSRGCPYRCSYCLSSIDKTVRFRDLELVKKELQFFLDKEVPQVKFVDRTFNCNHGHAMEIWRYILEHDNGKTNFHFEIAGDILTEEELELLGRMRPGLIQLEVGVQSTNVQTLDAIRRPVEWGRLKRNVERLLAGENIHIHLDLIAGLPYEDFESFGHSFDDVYACRPHQLQLGFLKVLKGSMMQEEAEKYGIAYMDRPPYEVLFTKWLSFEEVCLLKQVEEMVELYYNSAQFVHTLPELEKHFPSAFGMYRSLAEYYKEQGFWLKSPSRAYRYQVLFAFAVKTDPERESLYRQLLTLDMYLRENLKSRPAFALPLAGTKEERERRIRFYQSELERPDILADYVKQGCDSRQLERMTHIERFTLPVWDGKLLEGAQEGEWWLLFDYQERNPLNAQARIVPLDL